MSGKEGITLGPYRIIEQIGEGGMATVYKAYQPSMDRNVALKILPEYYSHNRTFVERFIREARTIARLEHQNILPVHDFGEQDGITYMAMRYLDGGTLKDVMAAGQPTYGDALRIITQVCAALDYAHRQGVVHRDVKPANIMIDEEGGVYLTDFGIAKVLEGASELTATGAAIGTPAYMAPEQSMGTDVDTRTDIYAVGVILYELMTGGAPYSADTPMAVALAHIHEPLPMPRERSPDLPEAVEHVILKALAKQPDDRYQTADELSAAFADAVNQADVDPAQTTVASLVVTAQSARTRAAIRVEDLPPETLEMLTRGRLPAAPAETPARTGPPGWVWAAGAVGVIAVVAVLLVVVFGLGGGSGDETAEENDSADQSEQEEQEEAADSGGATSEEDAAFNEETVGYDSFDNPDYEGAFNDQLWEAYGEPGCSWRQEGSVLTITRSDSGSDQDCGLSVNAGPRGIRGSDLGTFEARLQIGSDLTPPGEGNLNLWADLPDGQFYVICGLIFGDKDSTAFLFEAGEPGIEGPVELITIPNLPFDTWYTSRIEVDPTSMIFSCYMDDELVGTYRPGNISEMQEVTVEARLHSWHPAGSQFTFQVDDVKFESPALTDIVLYDDFEDPAFDGSFNPDLWEPPREELRESCRAYMEGEALKMQNNPDAAWIDACTLTVREFPPRGEELTSVFFDIRVVGDGFEYGSEYGVQNHFFYDLSTDESQFTATCGPTGVNGNLFMDMHIYDAEGHSYESPKYPIRFDTTYQIRFEVDPSTMTFVCYVDEQEIGRFTPENAAELQARSATRHFYIERAPDAFGMVLVDNFGFYRINTGE